LHLPLHRQEKNLTVFDIVTPKHAALCPRGLERKEPLPISIPSAPHPIEITGSGYRAHSASTRWAIAGGIRGAPVELAPCETIDLPYIADAEIVLEPRFLANRLDIPRAASANSPA